MSAALISNSSPTSGAQTLVLNSLLEQPCSLETTHTLLFPLLVCLPTICFKGINIGAFLSGIEYPLSPFHLV